MWVLIMLACLPNTGMSYGLQMTCESIKSAIIAVNQLENYRLPISNTAVTAIDGVALPYQV